MSESESQSTPDESEANTDSEDVRLIFDSLTDHVASVRENLDALDTEEVAEMDDIDLVELRTEVKQLENTVEEVRKETVDEELKGRIEPGEKLYGLSHIESHGKYVEEDASTVIARAVGKGVNYGEFVDIKASKLQEIAPEIATIGRYEYTYLR